MAEQHRGSGEGEETFSDDDCTLTIGSRLRRDGGRPASDELIATLSAWTLTQLTAATLPPGAERDFAPGSGGTSPEQYELLKLVGRGGMGEVYAARQRSLHRIVAVKRLSLDESRESDSRVQQARAAFHQEALIAGRLEHPNIIPVHDLGRDHDGSPLLSMKLVEGRSWDQMIKDDFAALSAEDFLTRHLPILVAMAQAVAYAHSRAIVHRDLKPSQVLVGQYGEVLLTDWGLAIQYGGEPARASRAEPDPMLPSVESASSPSGTPALMAPEQTKETAHQVGPWTDVYLLGGTLYKLLTGVYPHQAESVHHSLELAERGEVVPPSKRTPERRIPEELEALALACLRPAPEERLGGAAEFVRRLTAYLTGASRRRESIELSESAGKEFQGAGGNYQRLNAVLTKLDRALSLWPLNEAARGQKERCLVELAKCALSAGDFTLARVTAERLSERSEAARLTATAEAAILRSRRNATVRRAALASTFLLLAVVIAGGYFSNKRIAEQRDRAEQNLQLAEAAQKAETEARIEAEKSLRIAQFQGEGAYQVVLYVLDQLNSAMEKELTAARGLSDYNANHIKHSIAAAVADPAVHYFTQLSLEGWPEVLRVEQAKRMVTTSRLLSRMGRYTECRQLMEIAYPILADLEDLDLEQSASAEWALAEAYTHTGEFSKPEALYLSAIDKSRQVYGDNGQPVLNIVEDLATFYRMAGRLGEAEPLLRQLLDAAIAREGEAGGNAITLRNRLGVTLQSMGRYEEAEEEFWHAVELLRLDPENEPLIAGYMNNIALAMINQGRLDEAHILLTDSVTQMEAETGYLHPNFATALANLGKVVARRGEHTVAVDHLSRALEVQERNLGLLHPETRSTLSALASSLHEVGRAADAIELALRLLRLAESQLGAGHETTQEAIELAAGTLVGGERFNEAAEMQRRRVTHVVGMHGEASVEAIKELAYLARILDRGGRHDESKSLLLSTLDTARDVLGNSHEETIGLVFALGKALVREGAMEEGIHRLREAIELEDAATGGAGSASQVLHTRNLAIVYTNMQRHKEAIPLMERSIALREAGHSEAMDKLGEDVLSLGVAHYRSGDRAAAAPVFAKAHALLEEKLGPDDESTLLALENHGNALVETGRGTEALPVLLEVVQRVARTHGPLSMATAEKSYWIGRKLIEAEHPAEAEPLFESALPIFLMGQGIDGEMTGHTRRSIMQANVLLAREAAATGDREEAQALGLKAVDAIGDEREKLLKSPRHHGLHAEALHFAGRSDEARRVVSGLRDAGYARSLPPVERERFEQLCGELGLE